MMGETVKHTTNSIFVAHPVLFVIFLLIGIMGFILLGLRINVSVYETYDVQLRINNGKTYIESDKDVPNVGSAFIYSDKNAAVFDVIVNNEDMSISGGGETFDEFCHLNNGKTVKLEVIAGTISVIKRIFQKNGEFHG
jgi:hypothetical protein